MALQDVANIFSNILKVPACTIIVSGIIENAIHVSTYTRQLIRVYRQKSLEKIPLVTFESSDIDLLENYVARLWSEIHNILITEDSDFFSTVLPYVENACHNGSLSDDEMIPDVDVRWYRFPSKEYFLLFYYPVTGLTEIDPIPGYIYFIVSRAQEIVQQAFYENLNNLAVAAGGISSILVPKMLCYPRGRNPFIKAHRAATVMKYLAWGGDPRFFKELKAASHLTEAMATGLMARTYAELNSLIGLLDRCVAELISSSKDQEECEKAFERCQFYIAAFFLGLSTVQPLKEVFVIAREELSAVLSDFQPEIEEDVMAFLSSIDGRDCFENNVVRLKNKLATVHSCLGKLAEKFKQEPQDENEEQEKLDSQEVGVHESEKAILSKEKRSVKKVRKETSAR
ncbi:MAG: hypothetical protein KatS3mg087_0048 [Patescibacteria group bacterium]|nr:MAG: hypothetical protein KatS3mg087_0048 [Patescibacteria group bacterium]